MGFFDPVMKAYEFIEAEKYPKAVEILEKAIAKNPENIELHAYLGEAYFLNKDYKKALSSFKKRDEVLIERDPLTPYITGYRGCIAFKEGANEKAELLIKKAIEKGAKEPEIYYSLAIIEMLKGNSSESLKILKEIEKIDPSFTFKKIQKLLKKL